MYLSIFCKSMATSFPKQIFFYDACGGPIKQNKGSTFYYISLRLNAFNGRFFDDTNCIYLLFLFDYGVMSDMWPYHL